MWAKLAICQIWHGVVKKLLLPTPVNNAQKISKL